MWRRLFRDGLDAFDEESVAVLTLQNRGMLFFNGSIYNQDSLEQAFSDYIGKDSQTQGSVLLVKAEADIGLEQFLEICRLELSGFYEFSLPGKLEVVRNYSSVGRDGSDGFQFLE